MTNYNRSIKVKRDNTFEREKAIKVVVSIIGLVLVAVLGFKLVTMVNARDKQVMANYEMACGEDLVCLRNLYYKNNLLK